MPRPSATPRRRSYDQYCASARALDAVGDRWTLLIVRELLAGSRRYTDLHADLPGVSTDMLATRLKDMERDGLATRRRLAPPASAYVYELTERGAALLPVLRALAAWGASELETPRPVDAVRAHWFAIPLLGALESVPAAVASGDAWVEVRLDEGVFHVRVGGGAAGYGDGPAPQAPDARLAMDTATCAEVARGLLTLPAGIAAGRIALTGDGPCALALRDAADTRGSGVAAMAAATRP
ncbi:winged helix-turn-helix transcriptional regulator [Streptomyces lichenis]|uniref:Helix-turn-helix transcriptional regulator n=1 Tax=Streptomyces lichenis TaxID=2306967 RepID=A0ABT0ICM1_9ACTN|nr:helix-turn-helix domain-containing protein [Streptomyces lichenis]MCK8679071.1 helix-turn-helix transcriptional regulator [Streptomyces lichenis]